MEPLAEEEYVQHLRDCGYSSQEITDYLVERHHVAGRLAAKICPTCDIPLSVQVDPRQAGPKPEGTTWVNYRCSKCRLMIDRAEPTP